VLGVHADVHGGRHAPLVAVGAVIAITIVAITGDAPAVAIPGP
jgi:hypothetical protein